MASSTQGMVTWCKKSILCAMLYSILLVGCHSPDSDIKVRVERCKYVLYDTLGVPIDSGYFPVTIVEKR